MKSNKYKVKCNWERAYHWYYYTWAVRTNIEEKWRAFRLSLFRMTDILASNWVVKNTLAYHFPDNQGGEEDGKGFLKWRSTDTIIMYSLLPIPACHSYRILSYLNICRIKRGSDLICNFFSSISVFDCKYKLPPIDFDVVSTDRYSARIRFRRTLPVLKAIWKPQEES